MNRRTLLTRIIQASAGLLAVCSPRSVRGEVPLNTVMTFAPPSWRSETARRMINESGEMWLAARERHMGRNPILIAFDDDRGVEVTRARNHWKLTERALTTEEVAERDECKRGYFPAFYSYHDRTTASQPLAQPQVGQSVYGQPYRLRAWIKNGRSPEWKMSIEKS